MCFYLRCFLISILFFPLKLEETSSVTASSGMECNQCLNIIMKIYEELANCSSLEEIGLLKKKLELNALRTESDSNSVIEIRSQRDVHDLQQRIKDLTLEVRELIAQGSFPEGITIDAVNI